MNKNILRLLFIFACGLWMLTFLSAQTKDPVLELWIKATDLTDFYENGDKLAVWKDARANGLELKSDGDGRPMFFNNGTTGGTPSVYFGKIAGTEDVLNTYFDLPLKGEWKGTTIFVVGTNLGHAGVVDTAPGSAGCLRTMGWLQITGTLCAASGLPYFSANPTELGVLTLTAYMDDDSGLSFNAYENGSQAFDTVIDPNPMFSVRFQNARIGNNNRGEGIYNGEIKEVLYYSGIMTDEDRQQIEGYLAIRHNLVDTAGLIDEILKSHEYPFGYISEKDVNILLPEVKAIPYTDGAAAWIRAEDIVDVDANKPINFVPAQIGSEFTSSGANRPTYIAKGLGGRPAILFEGNLNANPRTFQNLQIPLQGEVTEFTLAVAGTNLWSMGLFDTAPGREKCLRTIGAIQLTGSSLVAGSPFPLINGKYNEGHMIIVIIGVNDEGVQYIETFANGHFQKRVLSADDHLASVQFLNGNIGITNGGETVFNGMISEMMIFPKVINESERKQIEVYFSEKYAIAIKSKEQIELDESARSRWTNVYPRLETYSFSWYGNTFSGDTEWVQSGMSGLNVYPDGTVLATSIWDEPHKEIGFYKDGKVIGPTHTGGGFAKITFDDDYIYVGKSGMGEKKVGIARYKRSMDGESLEKVPFAAENGNGFVMFDVENIWQEAAGIALNGSVLFLTVNNIPRVFLFNKETGMRIGGFDVEEGGPIALSPDGTLWLGTSRGAFEYNSAGQETGREITDIKVTGITFSPSGELVLTDGGKGQQIIFYNISGRVPQAVRTIGEYGGVYQNTMRGKMSSDRLFLPTDIAVDEKGNTYVNNDGKIMRSYSPNGELLWELWSTVFCTASDFHPDTDGNDIYSQIFHYEYVPGEEPGKDWKIVGVGNDPLSFPYLSAPHSQNVVHKKLNNEVYRYGIVNGAVINKLAENGEIFEPVAYYSNGRGTPVVDFPNRPTKEKGNRFVWTDFNGNHMVDDDEFQYPLEGFYIQETFNVFIDSEGNFWEPQNRYGVLKTPLVGFTASGAPIYDLEKAEKFDKPKEFSEVLRCHYFPETDTMYLSGYTWDNQLSGHEWIWGCCGREAICYTDWSKPTRKIRSRMVYPEPAWDIKSMWVLDNADLLLAAEAQTSVIFVYNTLTGELIGILEPDPKIVGSVGWVDTDGSLRAFEKEDGSILVIEEDSWAQKEMIYHVKPIKTK